ncbi:MAG: MerR family transcriptional regulator [Desulfobulbaceae bacterium]|nr:MAG: MerR family transcriptional regulator [Desulfobulbaceae bacterium]
MTEIPDKLYFKIGEVSKLADVAPHVLRYWETEFSDIKPKRANSKQRLYRREDVELILVIKDLLHDQGYTISGAKKLIGDAEDIASLASPVETHEVSERLITVKEELLALKKLLNRDPS